MALEQCMECQNPVSNLAPSCPKCGFPKSAIGAKDQSIALVYWFVSGLFGGHKFYLKQPGRKTHLVFALLSIATFAWSIVLQGIFTYSNYSVLTIYAAGAMVALGLIALLDLQTIPRRIAELNNSSNVNVMSKNGSQVSDGQVARDTNVKPKKVFWTALWVALGVLILLSVFFGSGS